MLLISFAQFILWIVTWIFSVAINLLVVKMGLFVSSSSAAGIQAAWRVVRDLANIGIVGGMVAVAIGTILHMPQVNAQKHLVRLIIAALLVNFSFFFAGAIIDGSNFIATKIYQTTVATPNCNCTLATRFQGLTNYAQIGNTPEQSLVTIILNPDVAIDAFVIQVFILIFDLVTIFVFLSATSLLIGRFVALIFIIITSPFGIAAIAIPKINKYAKEWWEALFSQAVVAPVYFLLVGFSLTILSASQGAIAAAALNGNTGIGAQIVGITLTFVVATVFMLQSLKIAKQLSEVAKRFADAYKAGNALAGWMPKAYMWGGAFAGRNIVGRGAEWAGYKYRDFAGSHEKFFTHPLISGFDRNIKSGLDKLQGTKFGTYTDLQGKKVEFKDYGAVKKEREAREIELGEINKEQEQKKNLRGRLNIGQQMALGKLLAKAKTQGLNASEQKRFDTLIGKLTPAAQTRFDDLRKKEDEGTLTKEEENELKKLERKSNRAGMLGKLAKADERREHEIESAKRQIGADGKLESWAAFWTRQRARDTQQEGLGLQQLRDKNGKLIQGKAGLEDLDAYRERLDKMKIGDRFNGYKVEKDAITNREARGEIENIFSTLPDGFVQSEYHRNPKSLLGIAEALPEDKWLEIVRDKSVRRDIKNQMWKSRRGQWAQMVKDVRDEVNAGKLREGSAEYKRRMLIPYNYASRYIGNEEFKEMIMSNAAFADDGTRFEDLKSKKYIKELWNGSPSRSYMAVKSARILGRTAARDASSAKRTSMDQIRDRQHGAFVTMGFDGGPNGDKDFLPYIDGEVNLHAEERALAAAGAALKEADTFLEKNTRVGADGKRMITGAVDEEDVAGAIKEKRYAQMVLDAKNDQKKNPLNGRIEQYVTSATGQSRLAALIGNGMPRALAEKKVRSEGRFEAMREARDQYEKSMRRITSIEDVAQQDKAMSDFLEDSSMFLMHELVESELGAKDWYRGKSPKEVEDILNKRSWWSTGTSFGIDAKQLSALAEQDGNERNAFFEKFLMRGDDSLLLNYAGNEHLKGIFSWPDKKRMGEINDVRVALGKPPLPVVFSEEDIVDRLSGDEVERRNPNDSIEDQRRSFIATQNEATRRAQQTEARNLARARRSRPGPGGGSSDGGDDGSGDGGGGDDGGGSPLDLSPTSGGPQPTPTPETDSYVASLQDGDDGGDEGGVASPITPADTPQQSAPEPTAPQTPAPQEEGPQSLEELLTSSGLEYDDRKADLLRVPMSKVSPERIGSLPETRAMSPNVLAVLNPLQLRAILSRSDIKADTMTTIHRQLNALDARGKLQSDTGAEWRRIKQVNNL